MEHDFVSLINPKHIHSQTNHRQEQEFWPVRATLWMKMEKTFTEMSREMDPKKLGFYYKGRKGKRAGWASVHPWTSVLRTTQSGYSVNAGVDFKCVELPEGRTRTRGRHSRERRLQLKRKSILLTPTAFCYGLNMSPKFHVLENEYPKSHVNSIEKWDLWEVAGFMRALPSRMDQSISELVGSCRNPLIEGNSLQHTCSVLACDVMRQHGSNLQDAN